MRDRQTQLLILPSPSSYCGKRSKRNVRESDCENAELAKLKRSRGLTPSPVAPHSLRNALMTKPG